MGIFAQAAAMTRGEKVACENSRRLHALAEEKMEERYRRKNAKPGNAGEAIEFELKILMSLALAGWELDPKSKVCTKSFISDEALALAQKVLGLAEAKAQCNDDQLVIAQTEMDRILQAEAH